MPGPTLMEAFVEPVLHPYIVPATDDETLIVAVAPLQISEAVDVTVSTGFGKTLMITEPVVTHPSGLVTVTLYVVVATGETVIEAVFPPLLHRYELPGISLVAVSTELSPMQMLTSEAATVITGSGLTMTWMLAVPVQPLAAVPVTLYVVVVVGLTVMLAVVCPLLHSKVVAGRLDETISVEGSPKQMAPALAVTVSTGFGNTVTITDPVVTQPCGLVTVTL